MVDTVTTSLCRFSFPHLFRPTKPRGSDKEKYSISILMPRESDFAEYGFLDKADFDRCMAALREQAKIAAKDKWGADLPKKLKSPFLDAGDYDYEWYEEGRVLIRASSIQKPGVVDAKLNQIIDESEIYPGCWGRVSLRAFAYDNSGNRGVSFGLQNVQKVRDDDNIGGTGRSRPENDFAPVEGAAASSDDGADPFA